MPQDRGIRITRAQADRVNVRQLIGIALGCIGLGVLASGAATGFGSNAAANDERLANEPESDENRSPAIAAGPMSGDVVSKPEKPDKMPEAPASALAPIAGKPAPKAGSTARVKHKFERGSVSYARCESKEQRNGGAGCRRDPKLEAAVWSTLKTALVCYSGKSGSGQAELRLTLHHKRPVGIEWQAPARGRSLNLRAVSQCAGERLSKLRTHLQTDRTQVTFRFGSS